MDELLHQLKNSLQNEYKWTPTKNTMIDLFTQPNINDLDQSMKYDLSLLIGHGKKKHNLSYNENHVSLNVVYI